MHPTDPIPPDLALAWLALQAEWGAVDGLADTPQDHTKRPLRAEPAAVIARRPATPAPPRAATLPITAAPAAAQSLAGLRAALEAFDDCALKRTATQLVFADGSETARIMLIGEAPGGEEDRAGRPFVGPAGQLLDRMLASIGLDRTLVRIVNVVPWRPPGNRNPSEAEIAQCLPFLHQHIALIRPQRLLLLGAVAVRALIGGKEGISRVRGSWKPVAIPGLDQPVRAMATYHPAFLLRQPAAKRLAWTDLLTLRQDCVEAGVLDDAALQKTQSITES
ncbi:uracil-DNA glycosylase [Acidiphilium sp. PA]|uniref:uracil-DNA glycosylase n=1 Tax=Acidiphilium sp. PA TaxID=2871705 RepID=UPI0022440ACB|nr:uracil-DNA glycosylase [Acidiphilium sp. PA]MCW8308261.1 uracil-DNA glycosylase [Acidiphilium sp. PA]